MIKRGIVTDFGRYLNLMIKILTSQLAPKTFPKTLRTDTKMSLKLHSQIACRTKTCLICDDFNRQIRAFQIVLHFCQTLGGQPLAQSHLRGGFKIAVKTFFGQMHLFAKSSNLWLSAKLLLKNCNNSLIFSSLAWLIGLMALNWAWPPSRCGAETKCLASSLAIFASYSVWIKYKQQSKPATAPADVKILPSSISI